MDSIALEGYYLLNAKQGYGNRLYVILSATASNPETQDTDPEKDAVKIYYPIRFDNVYFAENKLYYDKIVKSNHNNSVIWGSFEYTYQKGDKTATATLYGYDNIDNMYRDLILQNADDYQAEISDRLR